MVPMITLTVSGVALTAKIARRSLRITLDFKVATRRNSPDLLEFYL
jgi:hypothetical protein